VNDHIICEAQFILTNLFSYNLIIYNEMY